MQQLNLRVPDKILDRIDEICFKNGLSRSEIIRSSLVFYLNFLDNLDEFVSLRNLKFFDKEINIDRIRDTSILNLKDFYILIASTSSGAIGRKERDIVKIDEAMLGKIMARCVLTKIISLGADPVMLISNFSVEYNPTGMKIYDGIVQEGASVGLAEIIRGHTEENFKTDQTSLSIVGIGVTKKRKLKFKLSRHGDSVFVLGEPKVGYEVVGSDLIDIKKLKQIREISYVHDMIPVGNEGIRQEILQFSNLSDYKIDLIEDLDIDIDKSAGPSTTILVTLNGRYKTEFNSLCDKNKMDVRYIGEII
jgi:hypothetical protein